MNTYTSHIIKSISFPVLVSFLLCLSACKDPKGVTPGKKEPPSLVQVGIHIHVSDPETIERKGNPDVNELDPNSLYAFVFDGDGEQARLVQFTKVTPVGGNAFVVMLLSSTEARKIFLIGNASKAITDNMASFDPSTSTYHSVFETLKTDPLPNNGVYTLQQPDEFPLIYESPLLSILPNMNIGNKDAPAEMVRNGSKITVINETPSNQSFVILAATAAYAPVYGYVLPRKGSMNYPMVKKTYMNPNVQHLCLVGMASNTETQALYLYESSTSDVLNSGVIVYARYNGQNGYYRLENANGVGNQEMCAFERNKHYIFRIKSVENFGYQTLEEACRNLGSNVRFEIDVMDRCSHEIISNHQYYFGLSNSEFMLFGEGSFNNIEVARIAHNAPASVFQGNLAVRGRNFNIAYDPFTAGNDGSLKDSLPIQINASQYFQEGLLEVRLGNLYYKIDLLRQPEVGDDGGIIQTFASPEFYQAKIEGAPNWIRLQTGLSDDFIMGSDVLYDLTNGFYIQCLPNTSPYDRSCVVMVNREGGRRIRALIIQKGD